MAGGIDTSSLEFTAEILALVAEIDEFKGAWRALGRIAPERLSSLRRVATIESIGSSTRIEGATFSDREVERLLRGFNIQAFASRDEQKVVDSDRAPVCSCRCRARAPPTASISRPSATSGSTARGSPRRAGAS